MGYLHDMFPGGTSNPTSWEDVAREHSRGVQRAPRALSPAEQEEALRESRLLAQGRGWEAHQDHYSGRSHGWYLVHCAIINEEIDFKRQAAKEAKAAWEAANPGEAYWG